MEVKKQIWPQSGESGVILEFYCANTILLTTEVTRFPGWRSIPTISGTSQLFHLWVLSSETFSGAWGKVDCALRAVSDASHSPWRSPAMSLLRTHFAGLIKARFPGMAEIQETVLPACPAASVLCMLPDAAQPPSLPWLGMMIPYWVMMLLRIPGIKLQLTSVRSDLVQLGVILKIPFVSSSWSMGSPGMILLPLPALEVEISYCLLVVL